MYDCSDEAASQGDDDGASDTDRTAEAMGLDRPLPGVGYICHVPPYTPCERFMSNAAICQPDPVHLRTSRRDLCEAARRRNHTAPIILLAVLSGQAASRGLSNHMFHGRPTTNTTVDRRSTTRLAWNPSHHRGLYVPVALAFTMSLL